MVFHHSVIQLGKYIFRLSLRSLKTGKPVHGEPIELSTLSGAPIRSHSGDKGMAQLLNELDELASGWNADEHDVESGGSSTIEPPTLAKQEGLQRTDGSPSGEKPDQSTSSSNDSQKSPKPENSDEPTVMLTPGEAEDTPPEEKLADSSEANSEKKKPGKLPEHLRQTGPEDPTTAASEALRNLFTK